MYNFLSQHRRNLKYVIWVLVIVVTGMLFYFAPTIFKESNVFFYTSSTIVQGFIALVALLGAVVVFKIQLEDQAMQKLSDGVENSIAYWRGAAAKTYTPTQMMNACKEILEKEKEDHGGSKDLLRKVSEKMQETVASRSEARNRMVDFAVVSFLNVSIALICLLFTPVFVKYWYVGGILLTANVYLSIFSLSKALEVVRSTMGYGFSKTL
jgi:hypothetical protein